MRVKCVICDEIGQVPDEALIAKKLRNRPIHTYMCADCSHRIEKKTADRIATGNFVFRRSSHPSEDDF